MVCIHGNPRVGGKDQASDIGKTPSTADAFMQVWLWSHSDTAQGLGLHFTVQMEALQDLKKRYFTAVLLLLEAAESSGGEEKASPSRLLMEVTTGNRPRVVW